MDHADVTIPDRPADLAPLPGGWDITQARLTEAQHVMPGDLVLGTAYALPNGRRTVDFHTDAYEAAPVPNLPGCGCAGHDALDDADRDKPLTVLTNGFPWDCCDVMPSDALVLIVPAARPEPADKEASNPMTFTHKGVRCDVYPTPSAPGYWNVRAEGHRGPVVTRRATADKAMADAKAVLDGDESRVTGLDTLARLLTL